MRIVAVLRPRLLQHQHKCAGKCRMLTTTVEAGAELSPTALSLSQGGSPFTVGTFEELQRTFHAEEVATFAEVSHQVGCLSG